MAHSGDERDAGMDREIVLRFMRDVLGQGALPTAEQLQSVKGLDRFLTPFRDSFPDLRFTVDDLVSDEDGVKVDATGKATHLGEFDEIAPTGNTVSFKAVMHFVVRNGAVEAARVEPVGPGIWHQLHEAAESGQPWYKRYSGGKWDAEGKRQLDFLVRHGLQPHHHLLDVGCGTLRGGVKIIPYLEPGHYFAVDASADAVRGANEALRDAGLEDMGPRIVEMNDFDFRSFGREFDFVLARSLFTEIPLNSIVRCVMSVEKVLSPDGRFYATFWENPEGKRNLQPIVYDKSLITYFDSYPYHYDFETFRWICEGTELSVDHLGEWVPGRNLQKVLVFQRRGALSA